jgi:3-isopropylmalate/(R)-2-methylmalate dehydratase small subunit
MEPFSTVTSIAAPMAIKDVDTDMIIPAQYLTSISRDGFGENLFVRLRATYPDFYMNREEFRSARILVSDSNFGCGSSREHAVWALLGGGIRVVIAPSFADIFTSNSGKNGLLLVALEPEVVRGLLERSAGGDLELTVSLEEQVVSTRDGERWSFSYDPFLRYCLMNGLDDMDYLRSRIGAIQSKKEEQAAHHYFSVGTPNR